MTYGIVKRTNAPFPRDVANKSAKTISIVNHYKPYAYLAFKSKALEHSPPYNFYTIGF